MGFFSGGGGFGQHNPMYRRQAEDMGQLQNLAQMYQNNPQMVENYLSNHPEGQVMKDRLGLESVYDLEQYAIPGLSTVDNYAQIAENLQGMPDEIDVGYDAVSHDPYQYNTQDVQSIGDEAYESAQLMQEEGNLRGFEQAMQRAMNQTGDRGFGPGSGAANMANTSLGRDLMRQQSDTTRGLAYQKARDMQDLGKFEAQQNMQKQQAQSGANQFASQFQSGQNQFDTQLKKQLATENRNFGMQKQNALANSYGMIDQKAMQPYNMMQNYFGNTAALTGPPKTSSPFEKVLGGVGTLAGAAGDIGGMVSGFMPKKG